MRYPEAIWEPGPVENLYAGVNACDGAILHSVEGHFSDSYRPADTMRQRGVSWPFTVEQTGAVLQHYELEAICWQAGSSANFSKVGIEHEGVEGEPLTPLQLKASIRLVRWIGEVKGWTPKYRKTIFQHFDFSATTCPNGRIPWEAYVEEDEVELQALNQSEAISKVLEAAQAVGPDEGQWFRITGGYRPKPGRTAYLVEVKE